MRAEHAGVAADTDSLARLYEEHAAGGVRLAYLLTGDLALAEDLVQEAFIRVIGRFQHLRHSEAFAGYLRRTIINLSYGTFRRRRVERAFLDRQRLETTVSAPPDIEGRTALWSQLQQIAPRQRAALVLRYFDDLSERQTADVMGCSVRTVKSLVARGLAAMRQQQQVGEQS